MGNNGLENGRDRLGHAGTAFNDSHFYKRSNEVGPHSARFECTQLDTEGRDFFRKGGDSGEAEH